MDKKILQNGFTLIEILVSMVIIAMAAIFSMTVLKNVSQQQISVRDNIQYILATKSIKNAFQEYLYSVNLDGYNDGYIKTIYGKGINYSQKGCNQYPQNVVGEERLKKTMCDIADSFSSETKETSNLTYNQKDIKITITKATSNNIQYFTVNTSIYYASNQQVIFDRMFVTQVAKGQVVSQ